MLLSCQYARTRTCCNRTALSSPMTRLTDARDPGRPTAPAPPHQARKTRNSPPARWLTDTRIRLGLGTAAVLVTALTARRDRVGHREARAFQAINGLPDSLYGPVWVIMQLGALGAVPAAAIAARLAHDRELAGRLLAGGPASGDGQRRPHPWPRSFRARVPLRARGRRARYGRGGPPAAQPVRTRCCCRYGAGRWPLSHLRGCSPPAGRCRRGRARAGRRGRRGPGLASERASESAPRRMPHA
jgi:hypothetical protein